jgi:uncharacterized membrane protein
MDKNTQVTDSSSQKPPRDPLRFHRTYANLTSTFGNSWFATQAEAFARFFGTPIFLGAQTLLVLTWVIFNITQLVKFDPYPFILLNLAFSLQSAYAAPLILLAQTRQADRDKASAEADAMHREALAVANSERQKLLERNSEQTLRLLQQNTELTQLTNQLTERIESLTMELHKHLLQNERTPTQK